MNVSFDEAVNSDNILLYAFGFDVILYIIFLVILMAVKFYIFQFTLLPIC